MADLTSLLSKFLVSLWNGVIFNAVLGGSTIGIPAIVKQARVLAQTAAVPSICAFTVGSSDGSFEVCENINITTSTTHSFVGECAYTDETNTARTLILDFCAPGVQYATSIANAAGAVPYNGRAVMIRAKAGTTITLRTQAAGTYTTVTFNAEGIIKQVA